LASQDDVEGKVTDNTICGMSPNNGIEIYSTAFIGRDATWVRNVLGGYKLAFKSTNPISFTFSGYTHLTDVIESKAGNNRIYVDCGNISECRLPKIKVPADTTILTGTLTAGNTTLTLTNAAITTTAKYFFFTNKFGVVPTDCTVSTGSMTLTFDEQSADVGVQVEVR
jgi:hypothetical protein